MSSGSGPSALDQAVDNQVLVYNWKQTQLQAAQQQQQQAQAQPQQQQQQPQVAVQHNQL